MASKAPERNNRRALGDIGNLICVVGKSQQVRRPVTRGFCAQFPANAQACNKKKPVIADGAAVVPERKVINKPPQKEVVVVKPKPGTVVIEISLDAEQANKEKPGTQESSRKDVQTSTSVFSASSKVTCGLADITKKGQIVDIDAGDVDNQLAAVGYVKDLYKFYKTAESSIQIHDYMDSQNQINENMRMILVDWLIQRKLGWSLTGPTPYVFLVRFVKAAMADKEMENMAFFLTELGLLQYGMVKFCSSMLAASATPLWNETLNLHTGFCESQLIDCAEQLVSFHSSSADHKLNSVYRKYSASERCGVALLAQAKII
ncbi:hypothetical protein MKX01_023377 [Papaver californicum]|nr:hypothetical protein MKX01_023377 [Papaver californicum]